MTMYKPPKLTTPKGVAVFPHLTAADFRFDKDGVYKTSLRLDPSAPGVQEMVDTLTDFVNSAKEESGLTKAQLKNFREPVEAEVDKEGDDTGMYLLKFKTKAVMADRKTGESRPRKLAIFDARGNEWAGRAPIYGGSVLRIAFSPRFYKSGSNVGVTLYLNAVQVVDLVTAGASAENYGFEVDDSADVPSVTVSETQDSGIEDAEEF